MAGSALQRKNMVESQVRPSDVTDRRITGAMQELPRERFVPAASAPLAYMDEALAVAPGRSLMAPRTFARLLQLAEIEPSHKLLIIGALLGYSAAVASRLAGAVVALDCDAGFSATAKPVWHDLGIANVTAVTGPLAAGWPAGAPYDVIFVEGCVDQLPRQILDQIAMPGRLICVEAAGAIGNAIVLQKSGSKGHDVVSRRIAFETAAPRLPGFEMPNVFSF